MWASEPDSPAISNKNLTDTQNIRQLWYSVCHVFEEKETVGQVNFKTKWLELLELKCKQLLDNYYQSLAKILLMFKSYFLHLSTVYVFV